MEPTLKGEKTKANTNSSDTIQRTGAKPNRLRLHDEYIICIS
jgi:hypothetical protein